MLIFSQLTGRIAYAIILTFDYWASAWLGGERAHFSFALYVAEGHKHFLVPTLGAGSVASL